MASHLYQLVINSNSAGQFCSNIVHYVFDDSGYTTTAAAAAALNNRWDAANRGAWQACLPDQVALLSVKSRRAEGGGGFEAVRLYGAGNNGTRAGGISASGLNPVIIHYPLDRRNGRGKTFLPGVRELDVSAGVFTDAFVNTINTQWVTLTQDLVLVGGGAPTAEFVVKSTRAGAGWWAVGESELSDLVGQQRRRQRPS